MSKRLQRPQPRNTPSIHETCGARIAPCVIAPQRFPFAPVDHDVIATTAPLSEKIGPPESPVQAQIGRAHV